MNNSDFALISSFIRPSEVIVFHPHQRRECNHFSSHHHSASIFDEKNRFLPFVYHLNDLLEDIFLVVRVQTNFEYQSKQKGFEGRKTSMFLLLIECRSFSHLQEEMREGFR